MNHVPYNVEDGISTADELVANIYKSVSLLSYTHGIPDKDSMHLLLKNHARVAQLSEDKSRSIRNYLIPRMHSSRR